MAVNQFDDLVEKMAQDEGFSPADSPAFRSPEPQASAVAAPGMVPDFTKIIDAEAEDGRTRLAASLHAASKIEPDRRAKAAQLAEKTGLPVDMVERNLDLIAPQVDGRLPGADELTAKNPRLARWLQEIDNAAIAKDDLPAMAEIEHKVKEQGFWASAYSALQSGVSQAGASLGRVPGLAHDIATSDFFMGPDRTAARPSSDLFSRAQEGTAKIDPSMIRPQAGTPEAIRATNEQVSEISRANPFSVAMDERAKRFHIPEMDQSITEEIGKGNYAKAGRTLALQFIANAPNQAAIIVGAMVNPALGLGFAGATTAAEANNRARDEGVDQNTAVLNAIIHGTAEAGFESVGTLGVLKAWETALAKQYGKTISKEVIRDFSKTLVYSMAAEGNEEFLTSITQDLSDKITGVNLNATEGMLTRAIDAGFLGAFSGGGMTAPMAIANHAVASKSRARQAEQARDFYTSFGESVAALKARERLPEAARQYVEGVLEAGPVENVFISPEAIDQHFTSLNQSPVKFLSDIGLLEQYTEAKESGADIKIPLAEWTHKVVDTEYYQGLADDIKLGQDVPASLSVNEQKTEDQKLESDIQAESEALDDSEAADDGVDQGPDIESGAQAVYENIKAQLLAAGLSEYEAEKNARVHESITRTFGERLGVSPQEIFDRYGLKIMSALSPEISVDMQGPSDGEIVGDVPSLPPIEERDEQGNRIYRPEVLNGIRLEVAQGELIANQPKIDEQGNTIGTVAGASTFPEYFRNKGYRREEVLGILEKQAAGERLTEKQEQILGDLYSGFIDLAQQRQLNQDPIDMTVRRFEEMEKARIKEFFADHVRIDEYLNHPESRGGKVLDTDIARSLLPEYNAGGRQSRMVYSDLLDSEAGRLVARIYEMQLAAGEPGQVWFLGGGPGSGKSEALGAFGIDEAKIVYDSVSSNLKIARERIDQALALGNAVEFRYVYNTPDRASSWIEKRFKNEQTGGRPVDAEYAAQAHVSALETAISLAEAYEGDNRVLFRFFDNSAQGQGKRIALDELRQLRYIQGEESAKDAAQRILPAFQERLKDVQTEVAQAKQEASRAQASSTDSEQGRGRPPGSGVPGSSGEGSGDNGPVSLNQGEKAPRGRIRFGVNRQFTIDLFQHKDLSTFLHESGHFYFEVLADLAGDQNANEQIKADLKILLDWFGVQSRDQVKVEHHEMFARAFEQYLMEGNAPSSALREVFAHFKVWLTNVYKKIMNLGVPLNDDVRGVMARMMATDEEIAQVEMEMDPSPLFADPEAAGLTGDKAVRYMKARAEARAYAEERLRARMMEDYNRARTAFYESERKRISAEIIKEVSARPVYRALGVLQKGLMPDGAKAQDGTPKIKIDRAALVQEFGKEILEKLPRPYIYAREGGLPPAAVAEMLGFETSEQMISEIIAAPKLDDLVEQMTEVRLQEEYPDILNDSAQLSEEAVKQMHNEKRAEMLRLELEHLASENMPVLKDAIRKVARRVPTVQEVRARAKAILGKRQIKDLKPHLFLRAEVKAAREAGELLAKGDLDGAFEAKRRELLNHELYRATVEAKEFSRKSMQLFKKIIRGKDEDLAKSRDTDLVNAARAVLANFGIGKTDKTAAQYLEPMAKYAPDVYETMLALVEDATKGAGPFKEVSVDTFVAMADSVKAMWDLSRAVREVVIDGRRMDKDEIVGELVSQIDAIHNGGEAPGIQEAVTTMQKVEAALLSFRASARRVESWARAVDRGQAGGPFTRFFVNPIMEATARFRQDKKARLEQFKQLIKPIEKEINGPKISAPELGYTFKNKGELLGAILHTGNESNLRKLLLGRKWATVDSDGALDTSRWKGFLDRLYRTNILTKQDMDAVQSIWDMMEEMKPAAQRAHKEIYGFYFEEITANEIVTPVGTYRGGYVPAIADSDIVEDASVRADKAALEDGGNSFMFPSTGRGFTKSRVDNYTVPLVMDLRMIPSHIDKVTRFAHVQPVVNQLGRIVFDKGFQGKLSSLDPAARSEMLVPYLQRAASQKVEVPSQGKSGRAMDAVFRFARRRAGMLAMTWNIVNGLQNYTGLFPAATMVKKRHLAAALMRTSKAPAKMADLASEKSAWLKDRLEKTSGELQGEIEDIVSNPSAFSKTKEAAVRYGYLFQKMTQNHMDLTVWIAAYDQAIENGDDEKAAVRYADSAVRLTQADAAPESVAAIETGSAGRRLFTMFSTYFNTQANLQITEQVLARELGGNAANARSFYVYMMAFAAPAFLSALISSVFYGKVDDDDDDQIIDDLLAMFFGSQGRYLTAMAPGVGQVAQAFVGQFTSNAYDDRLSMSPAINMVERSAKGLASVYKVKDGAQKFRAQDFMTAVGLATGFPTGIAGRPLNYVQKVGQGKTTPTGPIDFARGLATGWAPQ